MSPLVTALLAFILAVTAGVKVEDEQPDSVALESQERLSIRSNINERTRTPHSLRNYPQQQQVPQYQQQQQAYQQPEPSIVVEKQVIQEMPAFFENFNQGKLGFSSYIQHSGETSESESSNSLEIKKLVPKSSVQIEMFHTPSPSQHHQQQQPQRPYYQQQQQQQQLQKQNEQEAPKEATKAPKYKSRRNYKDTLLANLKKGRTASPSGQSNTSPYAKEVISTTPNYPPNFSQPKPTYSSKRKPYHRRQKTTTTTTTTQGTTPSTPPAFQSSEPIYSHSSAYINNRPQPQQNPFKSSPNSINPTWKNLGEGIEIAASDNFKNTVPNPRVPKEISYANLAGHHSFYDSNPARFKSEGFDHEKALRSSTSFNIDNVMNLHGNDNEFSKVPVKEVNFDGNPSFHMAYGDDIAHAFQNHYLGSSTGPVQFTPSEPKPVYEKENTDTPTFDIPVMTEEEFETKFGKYRQQFGNNVPEFKFKQQNNRVPFNIVRLNQKVPKPIKHQQQIPHSFFQYKANSNIPDYTQVQNLPLMKTSQPKFPNGNIDLFPSLSFGLQNRRNVSVVPERHGRVISENSGSPQQFSVSASYQINKRSGF